MPKMVTPPATPNPSPDTQTSLDEHDTAACQPEFTARSAELHAVNHAVEAATEVIASAMQDLVAANGAAQGESPASLFESVAALMKGLSPDEAAQLRGFIG